MSNKESRLVYSTDAGRIKETQTTQPIETDGIVRIRRETKGRKGQRRNNCVWHWPCG